MTSSYSIRPTVRVLLINNKQELLLMCVESKEIRSIGKEDSDRFWVTVGGEIEKGETVQQAALRELFEETGIQENEVTLGPIVWLRELDLILYGKQSHIEEQYIVAKTNKQSVTPTQLTEVEKDIVKKLQWFSLVQLVNFSETVYPIGLASLMKNIIDEKYPIDPVLII